MKFKRAVDRLAKGSPITNQPVDRGGHVRVLVETVFDYDSKEFTRQELDDPLD